MERFPIVVMFVVSTDYGIAGYSPVEILATEEPTNCTRDILELCRCADLKFTDVKHVDVVGYGIPGGKVEFWEL